MRVNWSISHVNFNTGWILFQQFKEERKETD